MLENEKPMMEQVKIVINTKDGKSQWGHVMLESGIRIQDLMNDDRKFIPVFLLKENKRNDEDQFKLKIISKDFINYLEEN